MYGIFGATVGAETIDVVAIAEMAEEYHNNFFAAYGQTLSQQDIVDGEAKIVLDSEKFDNSWIGKEVDIGGKTFEVIGLCPGENYVPFYALDDSSLIKQLTIILERPLTSSCDKESFKRFLAISFSQQRIIAPESTDTKSIFDFSPMMLPTIILVVLGFLNLSFFVRILYQNSQETTHSVKNLRSKHGKNFRHFCGRDFAYFQCCICNFIGSVQIDDVGVFQCS